MSHADGFTHYLGQIPDAALAMVSNKKSRFSLGSDRVGAHHRPQLTGFLRRPGWSNRSRLREPSGHRLWHQILLSSAGRDTLVIRRHTSPRCKPRGTVSTVPQHNVCNHKNSVNTNESKTLLDHNLRLSLGSLSHRYFGIGPSKYSLDYQRGQQYLVG